MRPPIVITWLLLCWVCVASGNSLEIRATSTEIVLRMPESASGSHRLLELAGHTIPQTGEQPHLAWEGEGSDREIRLPRRVDGRDRLFSRFELREAGTGRVVVAPQWVTDLTQSGARDFAFPERSSKKGLNSVVDVQDAKELGAQHACINISMRALLAGNAAQPAHSTIIDGHEVPMNPGYVRHLDQQIGEMTEAGMSVTGILLNIFSPTQPRDSLIHPGTNISDAPNKIGAFNVTSPEGLRLYRAAVQFLAERYTRPDRPHGWMTGLIVGNEVQSHWQWHNQGDAPADEVLRDYHAAIRVADLIGRSIHSRFTVYVSLDYYWTESFSGFQRTRSMPGDDFMRKLTALSREGGDFPWALAFHPYPENLFEPAFWTDRRASHSLDTPIISFQNIEILPVALREDHLLHHGKPRRLALTEQGFHRKKGETGEQAQAAALALGYRKIDQIPEIEFFLLHRHQDHPDEGGLLLGVLDLKKRRTAAWTVYRSIDTPAWRETAEATVGVAALGDWAAAQPSAKLAKRRKSSTDDTPPLFDLYNHAAEAELRDVADFRSGAVQIGDSWGKAILHHPKPGKPARARFVVNLPELSAGKKLILETVTSLEAPSHDGVGFRIIVNEKQLLSADQRTRPPERREVDLSQFAGTEITLDLVIDPLGNSAHDLAAWVRPQILLQ